MGEDIKGPTWGWRQLQSASVSSCFGNGFIGGGWWKLSNWKNTFSICPAMQVIGKLKLDKRFDVENRVEKAGNCISLSGSRSTHSPATELSMWIRAHFHGTFLFPQAVAFRVFLFAHALVLTTPGFQCHRYRWEFPGLSNGHKYKTEGMSDINFTWFWFRNLCWSRKKWNEFDFMMREQS